VGQLERLAGELGNQAVSSLSTTVMGWRASRERASREGASREWASSGKPSVHLRTRGGSTDLK
jgi:hypothetical protein